MPLKRATTIRQLYQLIEGEAPELLDAPLTFSIQSATSMRFENVPLDHDLWGMPRSQGNKQTGEEPRINIQLHLTKHTLSERRK